MGKGARCHPLMLVLAADTFRPIRPPLVTVGMYTPLLPRISLNWLTSPRPEGYSLIVFSSDSSPWVCPVVPSLHSREVPGNTEDPRILDRVWTQGLVPHTGSSRVRVGMNIRFTIIAW